MSLTETQSIIVRNILGTSVKNISTNKNIFNLDISDLENGIYFIEISTKLGKRIEKIILAK